MSENNTREETVVHYENNTVEHVHSDECVKVCNPAPKVIVNAPKKEWLTMPMAILLGAMLIAGAVVFKKPVDAAPVPSLGDADPALLSIMKDDHVIGNRDANVVLMEWSDPECPFCQRHHQTINELLKKYDGKIAFVYRHYTLPFHTKAPKEAEAIECAGEQGGDTMFFKYLEKIFEVSPENNGLDPKKLPEIAQGLGLNMDKFNECLDSGRMAARVARDQKNGEDVGVTGTPHNIIWDKKSGANKALIGAQPISEFTKIFSRLGL